ncbi:MAG: polymer-forming cytoskeletal protein [Anaerolineales bacterium]|nr:polymer-forming cytoskeletal protein [Anaerolineales bacterium]
MIRSMTICFFAAILLAIVSVPFMVLHPGEFVLGGHYHIGPGETLKEDVSFYFTQVTIDESASVDGHVFLYSSTLDLHGRVTEDIHAFESDLALRETARVDGEIDEIDFIHWTLLLPTITQVP